MVAPPSLRPLPRARRTLAGTLLGYVVAAVLAITLTPFQLRWPEAFALSWYAGSFDLTVNVALFVPLGFLFGIGAFSTRRPVLGATFAGLGLSAFIEGAQMFVEGRHTSPLDLATNTLGALLGALLHGAVRGALHRRLAERLSLELPLMALFYLLVPLAWLHGLVAITQPSRAYLSGLFVLFGAYLFGAVYHHRLRPSGALAPRGYVLFLLAWVGLGALPGALANPLATALLLVLAGLVGLLFTRSEGLFRVPERRFEIPTLRRGGPLFGVFVLALAVFPPPEETLTGTLGELSRLHVAEWCSAWSLIGFLVAELEGRSTRDRGRRAVAIVAQIAVLALIVEGLRLATGAPLRPPRLLLAWAAAAAGAVIYRVQLAAVKELVGAPPSSR